MNNELITVLFFYILGLVRAITKIESLSLIKTGCSVNYVKS